LAKALLERFGSFAEEISADPQAMTVHFRHRSRKSRGALPGQPKSRGTKPAWNQQTKL
jgi:hypothetical protein